MAAITAPSSSSDPVVGNCDRALKMIQKRVVNVSYFKRLHEGSLLWLNAIRLTHENIRQHYDAGELASRAKQLLCLGTSMSSLLDIESPSQMLYALLILFSEFEYHFLLSGPAQMMKLLYAREGSNYPQSLLGYKETEPSNVNVSKFQNEIVLEFLQVPANASDLDYFVIFDRFCEVLLSVYEKLEALPLENSNVYNNLVMFDKKLKAFIISRISHEMNDLAKNVLQTQCSTMDNLFESEQGLRVYYEESW